MCIPKATAIAREGNNCVDSDFMPVWNIRAVFWIWQYYFYNNCFA